MAEYSGPWTGLGLPDNRYQRLFGDPSPQHGGGLLDNAANHQRVSINVGASAVIVEPIEVVARGRYYRSDASVTLTPSAPDAQRRIDRVVVRFDPAASTATLRLIKGTPASTSTATPALPALTNTFDGAFDVPIAQFEVNPISPRVRSLVLDMAYAGLPTVPAIQGHKPGDRGTAEPHLGQPIWDHLTFRPLWWDGDKWVDPRAAQLVRAVVNNTEIALPTTNEWINVLRYDSTMPQFGTLLRVFATCDALVSVGTGEYGPQFRWSMNNSQFGQIRQLFPASSSPNRWQTGTFMDWVTVPPKGEPFTLGFQTRNNTGQNVGMRVRHIVGTVEVVG